LARFNPIGSNGRRQKVPLAKRNRLGQKSRK
jgi:hypothetical protein